MTINGNNVEPVSIQKALEKLCEWLDKYSNVFLVAHNGRRFDFPVLIATLISVNFISRFFTCVTGLTCINSLNVFKKVFPGRASYKQEDLVSDLLHEDNIWGSQCY